eukprot:7275530-Prymnesium_polylepis.1
MSQGSGTMRTTKKERIHRTPMASVSCADEQCAGVCNPRAFVQGEAGVGGGGACVALAFVLAPLLFAKWKRFWPTLVTSVH